MNIRMISVLPVITFVLTLAFLPFLIHADDATTTPDVATSTPETATITIRDGDITAFEGAVELASSTTPPVDISPTDGSTSVPVPAASLLATLTALDATTADFDITDLAFFSSFNSFLINCIAIPTISPTPCFNWTYAVNGAFPFLGVDDYILRDGDIVHLFFGPPRQTTLSTTTVSAGESFTARAEHYDLDSGEYLPSSGLTLGVGTANPDFTFTELATATSDDNGEAMFTVTATGTYSVGIAEDFYFPSVSITILEAATSTEESGGENDPPPAPPSGGGGGGISHIQFNVPLALSYLSSQQDSDGSFGALLYSDWVAIAFGAALAGQADQGTAKTKLREYLTSATPSLSNTTDYERHAMALMALGINPYSGTSKDYISPIVSAFDGTQIGESVVHDDIFAIFPLLKTGYSASEDIIQKAVLYIVSKQTANGSWGDPDTTAAAVQALSLTNSLPDTGPAIAKAKTYLHSAQQQNGGFGLSGQGNGFSTSWVMQGIAALDESPSQWAPSGYYAEDYLSSLQQSDGGVESTEADIDMRVWATAYAIPASLEMTWYELLQNFSKPTTSASSQGGGGGTVAGAATSTATTTPTGNATSTISESAALALNIELAASTLDNSPSESKPVERGPILKTLSTSELSSDLATEEEFATSSRRQVAVAGSIEVPWFDNSWLWLLFVLFGTTAFVVFLTYVWERFNVN